MGRVQGSRLLDSASIKVVLGHALMSVYVDASLGSKKEIRRCPPETI